MNHKFMEPFFYLLGRAGAQCPKGIAELYLLPVFEIEKDIYFF